MLTFINFSNIPIYENIKNWWYFLKILTVLLSIYLYFKAKKDKPYIKIINKYSLILCSIVGVLMVILSLFYN